MLSNGQGELVKPREAGELEVNASVCYMEGRRVGSSRLQETPGFGSRFVLYHLIDPSLAHTRFQLVI